MDIVAHRYNAASRLTLVNVTQRTGKLLAGLAYFAKNITEDFLECSTPEHDYFYIKIPEDCRNQKTFLVRLNIELELLNYHA